MIWSRRSSPWDYRECMSLGIGMVTIDCAEPRQLAAFGSKALDVPIQGDYGDFVFLARPGDGGPVLGLQRVPEPCLGKNRVHVDLSGGSRETEVPRLVGLGAALVGEHEMPGLAWTVLTDPEGNEFCVGEHTDDPGNGE
jgi:hypothetical protein